MTRDELMAEVARVEKFIDGKPYTWMHNGVRGKEFGIVIPWDHYCYRKAYLIWWMALKMIGRNMWRAIWADVRGNAR